jgi:hypothetical protein
MANLAEWRNYITGGQLFVSAVDLKVKNKFPWCVLSFSFNLSQSSGEIHSQQNQIVYSSFRVLPISATFLYNNIEIIRGFSRFRSLQSAPLTSKSEIEITVPIEAIAHIESKRSDDVQLYVTLSVAFIEETQQTTSKEQWHQEGFADFVFNLDLSEKKWLKLLAEMGYNDKWIVELDRPKLEGFSEVKEHLNKAQDALYDKKEPEDVLRDLRAARDSFKVFYESRKKEISELIDKGSQGERGQKSKSERIDDIYEKVAYLLNIGPHNDRYMVTYADAQLAFRQLVSILSYISGVLTQLKED